MGVRTQRFKFWPFHLRKLKLRLFGSYDLNGAHYIVTDFKLDPETGRVYVTLLPYEYWAEDVRIK
jgi:hypothetical protein